MKGQLLGILAKKYRITSIKLEWGTWDWALWGLGIVDRGLRTLGIGDWGLGTGDWGLGTRD